MNFYRVACRRLIDDDDDEPRVAIVAASSEEHAAKLCEARSGSSVYSRFEVIEAVEPREGAVAVPSGPARVLGFEGEPAGTWE